MKSAATRSESSASFARVCAMTNQAPRVGLSTSEERDSAVFSESPPRSRCLETNTTTTSRNKSSVVSHIAHNFATGCSSLAYSRNGNATMFGSCAAMSAIPPTA